MFSEVISNVLHDGTRLGQHQGFVQSGRFNCDGRGFAQRVDLLQLWGRMLVLLTHIGFDSVIHFELFEQPHNALAARLIEPEASVSIQFDVCRL